MFFKFGFNIAKPPVHHASGAFLKPFKQSATHIRYFAVHGILTS